jgi:hypothetical protein
MNTHRVPVTDEIPRSEVVVADQVLVIRGDHHFPLWRLRWLEALGGIMELSDKGTEPAQFARCERRKSVGRLPGDVLQDMAPEFVAPQRAGHTRKTDLGEVVKQRLDSRGASSRRLAHGRADPDNRLRDVPALNDMLH